ncbi:MAG TPA: hypothetical protein PL134_04505 [Smithellaceae bacterium]|nr:MAG: hypothetical protein BWY90_01096 [Deltaproteobacteria bacterium ADurb.BinA014]HNQ18811.1 hypothetical protein [Smithellaceae bacterium]HNT91376.1 hypothetical protein [Smithellaceae bacterium]HNV64003.1 hypothetical protein [Smithellaceae bacterium]HOF78463.1 hypothetical protein [Smithellaceae bacterium]
MKKSKAIYPLIFATLLFFTMLLQIDLREAYAHPPQDVQIAYDVNTQTLTVTITHKSGFGFHYINSVIVKKNGVVASTNKYDKQPDPATFSYTYKMVAGKGDNIEVTAICNLSGNKTATIDVK